MLEIHSGDKHVPKPLIHDAAINENLKAPVKMSLPLTNQFMARIALKGVDHWTKMAKDKTIIDKKTLT